MEHEWINKTVTALQKAGLRAQRGYPSGLAPSLEKPLAAVFMKSAEADDLTLTIQLYTSTDSGCSGCEDLALTVAEVLRELGAACQVGQCSFHEKLGLFTQPVQAGFTQPLGQVRPTAIPQPQVEINGVAVETVLAVSTGYSCTASEGVDADTDYPQMVSEKQRWMVTIEDLVESTRSPHDPLVDGFSVRVYRTGERETYTGCCWSKLSSEITAAGIRRVRVAVTCNEPEVYALS